MKKVLSTAFLLCCAGMVSAQSIDLNKVNKGQESLVQEPGYLQWDVSQAPSDTKTFDNGLTIMIAATGNATTLKETGIKTHVHGVKTTI